MEQSVCFFLYFLILVFQYVLGILYVPRQAAARQSWEESGNQFGSSDSPVVVWPPWRQAGGDQRGLSTWAHVEPTAAPQANYRSLHMVTFFNSRIWMAKSLTIVGWNESGKRFNIVEGAQEWCTLGMWLREEPQQMLAAVTTLSYLNRPWGCHTPTWQAHASHELTHPSFIMQVFDTLLLIRDLKGTFL